MSLQDFITKGGAVSSANRAAGAIAKPSSLADFIKNNGVVKPSATPVAPIAPVEPALSPIKTPLRWVGKQLSKPGNILAAVGEGIGKSIQGDPNAMANIPKNVLDVATGKSTRGFLEQAQEAFGPEHKTAGTIVGLATSIIADPLNVVGGGLTKLGKLAKIVTEAEKAGQVVEEGSKVWNTLQKAGYTAEELKLAATKSEQALQGQRAFLKAGNIPLLPAKTSAAIYSGLGKTGEAISKLPGAAYAGEKVAAGRRLFNTGTGNEAFDRLARIQKNDQNFMGNLKDAIDIKKDLVKFSKPEEYHQVADYIEKEILPTNEKLKEIGDRLKPIWAQHVAEQQAAGLPVKKIENYFAHIVDPKAEGIIPEGVGRSKVYSTALGRKESREVMKFKSADGKEIINTVKGAGLRPVDNVKGLSHDITWGEYTSLKQIEDRLAESGIKIVYKPEQYLRTTHGNALGYFSPATREVVIASKRPTLGNVMSTLKHELTHNAHFQLAGNIEMLDAMAHSGDALQHSMMTNMLKTARGAVQKEWRQILQKVNGITPEDFAKLSKSQKDYYQSTTELLARVGQSFLDDPAGAKIAFPESFAAFNELRKIGMKGGFDLLDTAITPAGGKIVGDVYKDVNGKLYQTITSGIERAGVSEVKKAFGKPYYVEDPALALAYTIKENARAVSTKKFLEGAKAFAVKNGGMETTIPELKGLFFEPAIAKHLDAFHEGINPKEVKALFKMFDTVQNLWKGQALLSFSYHTRNAIGNMWNLFLMGVKNPAEYVEAAKIQKMVSGGEKIIVSDIGKKYTGAEILDLAKRNGVIGTGQYTADIPTVLKDEITGGNYNPLSQNNKIFRANRWVGGGIEDNAKLTGFIHELKKGATPETAAMQVKKFLFDYTDLTSTEQNILKRFMPFYTFTRKNVPLQFEQLMKQPGKYSGLERTVQAVEDLGMGENKPANEKYLSDYIKSNTAMRVKYNANDKSYSYMLLGKWIPAYQAMDWLAQPGDNIVGMLSPILKSPFEVGFNTSSFWKNSLGDYQDIERYPGEQTSFLGLNMRKKTAQVLRNLTLLNNIDKANPGLIFGGKQGDKAESLWAKMGMPAVNLPLGIGNISPTKYKYPRSGVAPTAGQRTTNLFLGSNLTSYKPTEAKTYYNQDTDKAIQELERAVARARATKDSARAQLIQEQIRTLRKERGR